jgi:eukaryotic-like serine/threonine-protein kinase
MTSWQEPVVNPDRRVVAGRYEIREMLGRGGMATVYRAHDRRLGRDVAVKMMHAELADDGAARHRFECEARNAAALNHPSIVAVHDAGPSVPDDQLPYLVMERVEGRSLRALLAGEGPLPPEQALAVTAEICAALTFSHAHGVLHRDIKPGNVMLTTDGRVKVVDFGIASTWATETELQSGPPVGLGTVGYLPPEQACGEIGDPRSDIYATGCVLYELLCGRRPYADTDLFAYQHPQTVPTRPSATNPQVPTTIDAIVLTALANDPADRYQSAAAMARDLRRAAGKDPVAAATPASARRHTSVSPTAPITQPAPARRSPSLVGGSLGWIIVALIVGAVFMSDAIRVVRSEPGVATSSWHCPPTSGGHGDKR